MAGSSFSIKGSFDGQEMVQGLNDVKTAVEGVGSAGETTKKSLSQMLKDKNATTNYRRQLSLITAELTDLSINFAKLTDQEKNSDFGRAMSQRIEDLTVEARSLTQSLNDVSATIKGTAADIEGVPDFGDLWSDMQRQTEQTRAKFESVQKMASGVASGFAAIQGAAALLGGENENLQRALLKVQSAMAIAQGIGGIRDFIEGLSQASIAYKNLTTATNTATVAQHALNTAQKANVFLLIASAIVAAGMALYEYSKNSKEAKQKEEELKQQQEETKRTNEKLAQSVGSVVAEYNILKNEYSKIDSLAEKQRWIEENRSSFEKLGLSIEGVNDADYVFIKNSKNVIEALKARARAEALQEKYKEAYIKAEEEKMNLDLTGKQVPFSFAGEGQKGIDNAIGKFKKYGITEDDYTYKWGGGQSGYGTWTIKDSSKAKLERVNKAIAEELKAGIDAGITVWEDKYNEAILEAERLEESVGEVFTRPKGNKGSSGSSSGSSVSSAASGATEVIDYHTESLRRWQAEVSRLQDEVSKLDPNSEEFGKLAQELIKAEQKVAEIQEKLKEKVEVEIEPEIKEMDPPPTIEAEVEVSEKGNWKDFVDNNIIAPINNVSNVVGSIDSVVDSIVNFRKNLNEAKGGWKKFMVGFSATMNVISALVSVMELVNTIMAISTAMTEKDTAAKLANAAASGAKGAADAASAASAATAATAETAKATAGAASSVSWLPIVGPILAVAAIAAIIGAILSARSKGKFAAGGIVPGFGIGDYDIAQVNGGEMILNGRQQKNLFRMIDQNRLGPINGVSGDVIFRIQGDTLVGVIDNYNKKRARI